ncbi:hypothetical protein E4T52_02245 [Aureobasidium sp. EXF-3400]|nr:hypothetical protein E4T51_11079 [Aureobasidium sp. EXF-12344]KAI4782902.1 hypothetical protein E4T52_02245 [Aureobasidium sp. EXF-3400]
MYTPIHSSPRLELRPKRVKAEHAIMDANRLVHKGDYAAAIGLYNKLLDERCHPVYYLNRALCFIATDQPHLAVNDALRAYIMAQSVIDAIRNNEDVNDHVRRIDAHIITYADDCADALSRGEEWCTAPLTMLDHKHQNFKLARLTLVEELEKQEAGKRLVTPPVYDLKHKALFRLVDALSRCGRGPSYNALHLLGDVLMASANKKAFQPFVGRELQALSKHIQDKLLDDVIEGKISPADLQFTQTGFGLLSSAQYGFAERPINYNLLNNCILSVDSNAIVHYEYRFGMPASLMASQDVFQGMVLFTESLPFVVSTANTTDQSELATVCDVCGTDLQMPSPFVLRVLIEELKQAESELDAKKKARVARRNARTKSPSVRHHRTPAVDTPQGTPPNTMSTDEVEDEDTTHEQTSLEPEEDGHEDSASDSDDNWNSESSTGTCSEYAAPDTPHRGRARSRPGIFETSDIQVCRYGIEKQRENFSFCSVDCYDLAKATYHDSICGSHIEDYLRKSIITVEDPRLPSVKTQKLVLLLLVRILGWAYATSTDPLDLPVVQMLMASPRHPPSQGGPSVPWSFHSNVLRPYQIHQALDGRGDAPKSVTNPNYSDGRVINTIVSLIQRHIVLSDKTLWTKTFDEDGYHEQTFPCLHESQAENDTGSVFGRLHPLCDLVPLAATPEAANVELVDLGGGQIVCLPIFATYLEDGDYEQRIKKSTRLLLRDSTPRLATKAERAQYAKLEDYGEGGTMMDEAQDEAMLEDSESENQPQAEDQDQDHSNYVEEENYGYMADAEFDMDEDDEGMMDF